MFFVYLLMCILSWTEGNLGFWRIIFMLFSFGGMVMEHKEWYPNLCKTNDKKKIAKWVCGIVSITLIMFVIFIVLVTSAVSLV